MRKSTKGLLWTMIILLILLAGVIVWLILKDDKVIEDAQLGNTVIGEMAAQTAADDETEPETETKAIQAQNETETAAEAVSSVDIPNEKPVSLYTGGNGTMELIRGSYDSAWTVDEDIATFEAINSEEATITYDNYYTLHGDYWNAVETTADYKIGYELSFDVNGEHKVITILKPEDITGNEDLYMGDYPYDENNQLVTDFFSGYLGVWVYCDIGQEGIYVHLTQEDMTPDTLLTSIKLRPTPLSSEISNLKLKAFTYSSDTEFDAEGHYIGTHGYEISVNNVG